MQNITRQPYLLICTLVILIIYLGQLLGITSANDFVEKRSIAKFPVIDLKDPNFVINLNSYLVDNFGFRNIFLKQYLYLKFNLLKTHKIYHTDFNDQGWIFGETFPGSDYGKIYQNAVFTSPQLLSWKNILQREKDFLQKNNIPYFLVIIPDRRIIYSDLLPFNESIAIKRHYQFVNYIKQNSNIDVIDPTEALLKAKNHYPLFFKTDSHWTNYGAFIAYKEIMNRLKKYKPDLEFLKDGDFDISLEKFNVWLGDGGFIYPDNPGRPEHNVKFSIKESSIDKYPKLNAVVEYGDSYTNINRRICLPCFTSEFPEAKPLIPLLFKPTGKDKLLDPNPDYALPKYPLEQLIPIIIQNVKDKNLQSKIINYIKVQGPLPEEIGLDYFFKLQFTKIVSNDLTFKLDRGLVKKYLPDLVIREAIDNRVHEFSRLKCNYEKGIDFDDKNYYEC